MSDYVTILVFIWKFENIFSIPSALKKFSAVLVHETKSQIKRTS